LTLKATKLFLQQEGEVADLIIVFDYRWGIFSARRSNGTYLWFLVGRIQQKTRVIK